MKRRNFLKLLFGTYVSGAIISEPISSLAQLYCVQLPPNGFQQRCDAGIDSGIAHVTAASVGGQHMNQWCWAACIEMVFRYYGYNVPQAIIVQQTCGAIVNMPGDPNQIMMNLNRSWVDTTGRNFVVSGDAYSANPVTAAQDLSQNMPLIIGTLGHAMVLTSLNYIRDVNGYGNVLEAVVRDPWPGKGRRVLTPQEWNNTSFLARIRVF